MTVPLVVYSVVMAFNLALVVLLAVRRHRERRRAEDLRTIRDVMES